MGGGVATSDATNMGAEEEKEEQMEKSDEAFVKEEQEADEIQEGEKVDEEEEPKEDIPFKWKEGLKPDEEDLVLKPPDGIEEKRDPCLALGESFTEEEYDNCMAKGMENMQEETGSVEESSVGTMTAKVMTTSTVYTFADGTSVTETVDANGVKVLTTDSGQSITLGANVSQENMDTEVEPAPEVVSFTDAKGATFTDVTASEDLMVMEEGTSFTDAKGATFTDLTASYDQMNMEDVSFTDAKGKVFTDVTASEDGMLMEEGTSFTDAKGATFTDEMITFEEDEEEMSPPSEDEEVTGPVETMIAKVMTTSTVYTFADGTSVTETIDANGMKVLTTDSGQSITLSANVSQKDMDSEVEPTPEVVSFTDTEGKVFTDITASEDEMEPDEKSKGPINGAGVEVQFKPPDPYNNPTSSP